MDCFLWRFDLLARHYRSSTLVAHRHSGYSFRMDEPSTSRGRGELRVGAHVLIQLGAELVTDAEQAILELVKNAYDADSPGCRVMVDTEIEGSLVDTLTSAEAATFISSAPNVSVTMTPVEVDEAGQDQTGSDGIITLGGAHKGGSLDVADEPDVPFARLMTREVSYRGKVVIEDHGTGISPEGVRNSWLVVSRSAKRVAEGPKPKTPLGRTPLGDKGLGRLGTMKLGDVLLVESAMHPDGELTCAWFRWADCEKAATVDEVPVALGSIPNTERFKGTRISVLGLSDLDDWRRKDRLAELTKSLARLVSPFESASAFPVVLSINERQQSLGMVTDELLSKAVADFRFHWKVGADGRPVLVSTAKLGRRLFTSERTDKHKVRTEMIFGKDNGARFADVLKSHNRLKGYDEVEVEPEGRWFVEIADHANSDDIFGSEVSELPGPFDGAFYYFFLTAGGDGGADEGDGEADDEDAVIGNRMGLQIVKELAGIAILRDGFQVRNKGDWLGLSSGMTSGSSYAMRPENTIGYFALSGEHNYQLREKSDREGFVDDHAYRGFLLIARHCRDFANRALNNCRRVLNEYGSDLEGPRPMTGRSASRHLGQAGNAAIEIEGIGIELSQLLDGVTEGFNSSSQDNRQRALELAERVVSVAKKAVGDVDPTKLVEVIEAEMDEARSRNIALVESAAVGQAARGLTHELRTHLAEITYRADAIGRDKEGKALAENVRSIRRSCSAIASAAAQIDPMLPRTRAIKDTFHLESFFAQYLSQRETWFQESGVVPSVSGSSREIRINRARLLQVVDNMVRNSVYWLARIGGRFAPTIEIELIENGFVLSDNGPGIDPRVEDTLFELFVTTRTYEDGGQGLGLFISTELLALDGCTIRLMADRNDKGRRFRFYVDLSSAVV